MKNDDTKDRVQMVTPLLAATYLPPLGANLAMKYDEKKIKMMDPVVESMSPFLKEKGYVVFKTRGISSHNGVLKRIKAAGPYSVAHEIGHATSNHIRGKGSFFRVLKKEYQASRAGLSILKNSVGRKEMLKAIPVYTAWYSTYTRPILMGAAGLYGVKKLNDILKKDESR